MDLKQHDRVNSYGSEEVMVSLLFLKRGGFPDKLSDYQIFTNEEVPSIRSSIYCTD